MDYMKRNPELKMSKLVTMLVSKLDRSKESIRDRIRRHLSKMSDNDKKTIIDSAKVRKF